ncbi:hypothetical protein EI94DRAFT_1703459 [Lactarius quietus]|nr:hypothetical protein EI94DRAFT_1703459 [Lactarius quietus]
MSEDPSFTPGAVSMFDFQYPFHLGPQSPCIPLGSQLGGYPSPTFQTISTQATLLPMESAAPSGTSTAPASFFAPPSHHLGLPQATASFRNPPYDHRLEMSSVPHARQDIQDRDRHLPMHLPYCIGCSYGGCSWRGYRLDTFRKHWSSEHSSTIPAPDENGSQLYDPRPLVKNIVQNPASVREAEIRAVTWIKKKAIELDKKDLSTDPWGHKGTNLKGSRPYHRFSEMNTIPITSPTPAFSLVPPAQLWVSTPVDPRDPYTEAGNGQLFLPQYMTESSFGALSGLQ